MMLKYSLNQDQAAEELEDAVKTVLEKGYRTADIYQERMKKVGCREMGALIVEEIEKLWYQAAFGVEKEQESGLFDPSSSCVTMFTMSKTKGKATVASALVWQKWAKKRAQNAPSPKRVQEISKKVKISVTQLLLEERRSE